MDAHVENPSRLKAFSKVTITFLVAVLFLQFILFGGGSGTAAGILGTAIVPIILGSPALLYKKNPTLSYGIAVTILTVLLMIGKTTN